jgi:hypothetical protein
MHMIRRVGDGSAGVPRPLQSPAPAATPAPSPTAPSAAPTFSGPLAAEGKDTFDALSTDVAQNKLSLSDATLLAQDASRLGVMGEAEAIRSAHTAEALSPADAKAFGALLDQAGSGTERAFLYKALGAGYSVADVATFAGQIRGWPEDKLVHTLNLADATGADDGTQNGVKQQFEASCTATSAQAVRGELDPIYALNVRTSNSDVHSADDSDGMKLNPNFAAEQKNLLENVGDGKATARSDGTGYGTWGVDAELDSESAHTGFTYSRTQITPCDDVKTIDAALDTLASQLNRGIPTPIIVGDAPDPSGHCALALAVEGTGADEKFLIHDPWEGTTTWCSKSDIENGTLNVAGWNRLGYIYQATPSPLGVTTPPPQAPAAAAS